MVLRRPSQWPRDARRLQALTPGMNSPDQEHAERRAAVALVEAVIAKEDSMSTFWTGLGVAAVLHKQSLAGYTDVRDHTTEYSPIHDLASASVSKELMRCCTPWGSVIRTYHLKSSSWIG